MARRNTDYSSGTSRLEASTFSVSYRIKLVVSIYNKFRHDDTGTVTLYREAEQINPGLSTVKHARTCVKCVPHVH